MQSTKEMDAFKEKVSTMISTDKNIKNITLSDAAADLSRMLDKFDWFFDVVIEGKSLCVYVSHMGPHMANVPDMLYGYQVKEGFAGYLTCGEKYGAKKMALGTISEYE